MAGRVETLQVKSERRGQGLPPWGAGGNAMRALDTMRSSVMSSGEEQAEFIRYLGLWEG